MLDRLRYFVFQMRNRLADFKTKSDGVLEPLEHEHQYSPDDESVTVIITVWKRNNLQEQIDALMGQTKKPDEIWVYQCGDFVDVKKTIRKYKVIQHIHSSVNLKYFGRFSLACYVKTRYTWVLDDDVIPSLNWLSICRKICREQNRIVASAGRIIPKGDYTPERTVNVSNYFYGDVTPGYAYNFLLEDTIVDYGCNSWFLKTEWMKHFWKISPITFQTAEDIHLSAVCKILLNVDTIVPRQSDKAICGNLKLSYGRDSLASWLRAGFVEERQVVFHYFIDQCGWRPLLWDQEN